MKTEQETQYSKEEGIEAIIVIGVLLIYGVMIWLAVPSLIESFF